MKDLLKKWLGIDVLVRKVNRIHMHNVLNEPVLKSRLSSIERDIDYLKNHDDDFLKKQKPVVGTKLSGSSLSAGLPGTWERIA